MKKLKQVNVHDAKTHLSRLLEDVEKGGEVVIARAGKPVARVVPLRQRQTGRKPGFLKGRIRIAADFDAPLPSKIARTLEGRR